MADEAANQAVKDSTDVNYQQQLSWNQLLQPGYQHHQLQVFLLQNFLQPNHYPPKYKHLFQLPLSVFQAMLLQLTMNKLFQILKMQRLKLLSL